MIKSQIYRGKIYAGATKLACTILVEQTARMQFTVRSGTFTHTNGDSWILASDAVFNLASNPTFANECKIEIGDIAGVVDVWCGTKLLDGIEEDNPPTGWNTGHVLAFTFTIPPGTTNLSGIDIFVLDVLPGFPSEAQMAAMGIERVADGTMKQTGRT